MKNTTNSKVSMFYGFMIAMLVSFACLIAINSLSPQNVIIIAAAIASVVGAIVIELSGRKKIAGQFNSIQ